MGRSNWCTTNNSLDAYLVDLSDVVEIGPVQLPNRVWMKDVAADMAFNLSNLLGGVKFFSVQD
jgi:hypothetical protein